MCLYSFNTDTTANKITRTPAKINFLMSNLGSSRTQRLDDSVASRLPLFPGTKIVSLSNKGDDQRLSSVCESVIAYSFELQPHNAPASRRLL